MRVSLLKPMLHAISVVVVDDNDLVRHELRRTLEEDPEIVVIGEAGNGLEAVQLVRRLSPRVVVMDFAMPLMDGIQATREIMNQTSDSVVLMLSLNDHESCVRRAFAAGVRGYLMKNAVDFDLGAAVKAVACGKSVLGGSVVPSEAMPHVAG